MSLNFKKLFAACIAVCAMLLTVNSVSAQQASITLTNCDAKYCYTHNNSWTLTKEVTGNTITEGVGTVTWTVTATKDTSAASTFSVRGGLTIYNSGSASATIGNIVVNLQKRTGNKWVSVAADVANSTLGDGATTAKIASGASQEVTNGLNYVKSGQVGTFTETAGSGALEFTDATNNTVFSLVPELVIPVGESVTLLYNANFATAILPPAGQELRVEAIVTFGNSGARGGSGATTTNVDIDGNGTIDADEKNVRSVPCRITMPALPASPEECNESVVVTDDGATTTGTVTISNPIGFEDVFPAFVTETTSWDVSVDVNGGDVGGTVCNGAELDGTACGGTLNVVTGYDYDNPIVDEFGNVSYPAIYAAYECNAAASESDSACVTVSGGSDDILKDGEFCSFSQGGFGGNGVPFDRLQAYFAAHPGAVEVGIPGAGGYSMTFTSAAAVQAYLPAGGGANKLNADSVNPTSSSSGQFGGQVLALKLNIALSDAAINATGFGDLYYCDPTSSLDGKTVREILAVAEVALGGGDLPEGYTYSSLAGLCANLDLSFDGKGTTEDLAACGVASAWAVQYLKKTCN